VQKDRVSASYSFLLLRKATRIVQSPVVSCYNRTRPETSTTPSNWPRRSVPVHYLGPNASRCLLRLGLQIELRLPKPSMNQHKAMLLDPRVKAVKVHDHSESRAEAEIELREEHRALYVKMKQTRPTQMQGSAEGVVHEAASAAGAAQELDSCDANDNDEDAVPRPRRNNASAPTSRYLLELEADELWQRWMKHDVSWEEHTSADLLKSDNDYDVWKLYKEVDVLKWYQDVGASAFLSVAMMARVYLAKPMSNAFQERFFSTAGIVLGVKRTRLESSRAEKLQLLMHNSK